MRRDTLYYASVMALFGLLEPSAAFVSPFSRQQQSAVALNLVPGQGNQLVAAYNAANCKKENEYDDDEESKSPLPTAITVNQPLVGLAKDTPRNFVQRAFSLPSYGLEQFPSSSDNKKEQKDVIYFPLVGFTFCRNGDRVIPLPTQSNVSCRLRTNHKEEVYGWFSPVCKLDMYSEDLCHAPEETTKP
jgi:hypothetical protein